MPVLKKSDTHLDRSTDPFWWALAGLLSLGSVWLPTLLSMQSDRMTPLLVTQLAMFFSGGLLGAMRPDRVWRWGVAAFLVFGIRDFAQVAYGLKSNWFASDQLLVYLGSHAPGWAVGTIPMFIGAYIGLYLARGNVK